MSKPEFRVRPVIRHIVTRYTPAEPLPEGVGSDGGRASLETMGEFDSEGYAQIVQEALAERVADREYVIVRCGVGDINTEAYFAYSDDEAATVLSNVMHRGEFRVFSRIKA